MTDIAPLIKRSLVDQALEQLRLRIAQGVWAVGERLPTEPELSAELGISRNTVREAMRVLAFSGLIFVGTQLRVGSIEKPQVEAFHNYAAQRLINLKAAQAQADEALQKREEQIAHAADLEKVYAALLTELLEVASVDSSAKAIPAM